VDALAGGGELQRVEDAPIGRQRALLSPPPPPPRGGRVFVPARGAPARGGGGAEAGGGGGGGASPGGGNEQGAETPPTGGNGAPPPPPPPPESGALVCIRARVTQASEVGKPNVRGCVGSSPSITDRASVPNDGKISRGTRNET